MEQNDYELELAQDFLQKAYRLQLAGHVKEAIKMYERSLDILPTPEAWAFKGWAHSFLLDYDTAIKCCKNGIDLDSEYGNNFNDIGAYLIVKGDYEEAIIYLNQAIECTKYTTPHFPHYNLGRIYERRGDWFEALAEYKKCIDIEPTYEMGRQSYFKLLGLLN